MKTDTRGTTNTDSYGEHYIRFVSSTKIVAGYKTLAGVTYENTFDLGAMGLAVDYSLPVGICAAPGSQMINIKEIAIVPTVSYADDFTTVTGGGI